MIFCLAKKEDALQIANIHKKEISEGFLSSLHVYFLKSLYEAIIVSSTSFCIVAKEGDTVVGFISGVTDINKFYTYFFKAYFFQSIMLLFKKMFSISFAKKAFETILYPVKERDLPPAELLTMAVSTQFQRQGIAGKMFLEFLTQMKKRNVAVFKVLVGDELADAIHFYEKNGFVSLKETSIHNNKKSRIYIYNLP